MGDSVLERTRAWVGAQPSQTAAAERLGCTQSMLSRLLAGRRPVNLDLAAALERETEGAVKAVEFATPVARQYRSPYARKKGVLRGREGRRA